MEYIIVKAGTTETLIEKVNELIGQGWKPLGGIAISGGATFTGVYQAMVREKA
jgi:hypothetical protein